MHIREWISPPQSAVTGKAVVEVLPGELADLYKMIHLVDGSQTANFGVTIRCLGYSDKENLGHIPSVWNLSKEGSLWEVTVNRD